MGVFGPHAGETFTVTVHCGFGRGPDLYAHRNAKPNAFAAAAFPVSDAAQFRVLSNF